MTISSLGREVQENPCPVAIMAGNNGERSPEMIPFIRTAVAQPFITGRNTGLAASVGFAVLLFLVLIWVNLNTVIAAITSFITLAVNATVLLMRYQSHASTPLAVNINHPFMDTEPMGEAALVVRMSDGTWCDPGSHRVRAIPDELLGGFSLAKDTLDFPVIGHFSTRREKNPTMVRHLALINQAIALRDAVNDVPDPIEDAREREKIDSGLLERSWMEDEEQVEVESPLVSFFRRKD